MDVAEVYHLDRSALSLLVKLKAAIQCSTQVRDIGTQASFQSADSNARMFQSIARLSGLTLFKDLRPVDKRAFELRPEIGSIRISRLSLNPGVVRVEDVQIINNIA